MTPREALISTIVRSLDEAKLLNHKEDAGKQRFLAKRIIRRHMKVMVPATVHMAWEAGEPDTFCGRLGKNTTTEIGMVTCKRCIQILRARLNAIGEGDMP